MADSLPVKEFGNTARSMQDRKLSVANWIKDNESAKPNLVRAGKVIIYKLLSHMPLNAPCMPLDRCVELSPSYIAKVAETSPQTARNAWLELRSLIGWRELCTRSKIGKVLQSVGYEPRWPSGGRRWGTHIFIFSKLYTAIQSISEWLYRSGRYEDVSCVPKEQKIESSIVRIVNDKLNNINIKLDKNSSPCSPQRTKRKPRRTKDKTPWRRKGWKAKSRKEQMAELFSFMEQIDAKKSNPEARRRSSWLKRMSKIPPRFRYGLYRPGESIKSPNGQLAMCLIAEVNAAYGRVLEIDLAESHDEWFGYNLIQPEVVVNHTGEDCSLMFHPDIQNEEEQNAISQSNIPTGSREAVGYRQLVNPSGFLWSESKKSVRPKYEILADVVDQRSKWEMLGIVWGDGTTPPGGVRTGYKEGHF